MYPWYGMMNKAFHLYSLPLQNHKPLQTWEYIRLLPINECFIKYLISSVVDQSYSTLRDPMNCSTPSLPVYHQVPELPQTHVHRVSDAIQPSHPLSSTFLLPSAPPRIRVFPMSQLFKWGGQSIIFSFSVSPSKEHPGLISFRMDWLDLLAVQGTLKSLLQHHSSKASILRCSAFFTVQLSTHTWLLEKP